MLSGILECLARQAAAIPEWDAIVTPGARLSYAELQAAVSRKAADLQADGLQPGMVAPIVRENGLDFVLEFLGVLALGARPLLLPLGWLAGEREALLAGIGDAGGDLALPDAEIWLPTSGSTGTPQIVRLSSQRVAWNAAAHARSIDLRSGDRLLIVSPLYHAAPLVAQLVAALVCGAAALIPGGPFSPSTFQHWLARENVTVASLTPTHLRLLLDRLDGTPLPPDQVPAGWPSLRIVTVGAAPISPETLLAFRAFLARRSSAGLFVTYGLTEAGPRVTTLDAGQLTKRPGSVGRPVPGVALRIVDPACPEVVLPPDAPGELHVLSPSRMLGYVGALSEPEGWLATGDLASVDPEGFLTLHGRLKELILTGGVKISPREVEAALCRDARVADAAVVGEPHDVYGEIVKAYVVARSPVSERELLKTVGLGLASYKLPRRVVFVDSLPLTATGKVDRFSLISRG